MNSISVHFHCHFFLKSVWRFPWGRRCKTKLPQRASIVQEGTPGTWSNFQQQAHSMRFQLDTLCRLYQRMPLAGWSRSLCNKAGRRLHLMLSVS